MLKRIASLAIVLAAAGCSGGGSLSASSSAPGTSSSLPSASPAVTPSPTATSTATAGTTGVAKTITLAQNGATPTQGIPGTFTLAATEYDGTGKLLLGTYPQPIVVTTNDTADLVLSAIPSTGPSGGSVTIPNSQTVVLVTYDGLAVPKGTQFAGTANRLTSVNAPFTPLTTGNGVPAQIATIAIDQAGAAPYYGAPGQFALSISAYDANGNPITGSYATPIVLTTNDGTDLQMSTVQNAAGTASVSIPNAQTTVFVSYDGNVVPNGTVFSAFSGAASSQIAFDPTSSSAPPPVITRIGLTRNGANPILGSLGVFPVFVTAYDQNVQINGTLPYAIDVTLNETCDLSLSLGGSGSVEPCILNGVPQQVDNVGAAIINNADQVIFLNYDGDNVLPTDTAISATTLGNICTYITFPGNKLKTCPAPVPQSSRRRRMLR